MNELGFSFDFIRPRHILLLFLKVCSVEHLYSNQLYQDKRSVEWTPVPDWMNQYLRAWDPGTFILNKHSC